MKAGREGIRLGIALNVVVATSLCLVLVLTAAPASAIPEQPKSSANLRFECTGDTICSSGGTTLVTGDSSPTFKLTNTGQPFTGMAYVAVLTPNSGNFSSGKLGDFLATTPGAAGLNDYQFAALASASAQVGVTASSFGVELHTLAYDGINDAISLSGLPTGTVIVAWAVDSYGNVIWTPLSESVTVPEPMSLLLLGSGLVGLALYGRKRFKRR